MSVPWSWPDTPGTKGPHRGSAWRPTHTLLLTPSLRLGHTLQALVQSTQLCIISQRRSIMAPVVCLWLLQSVYLARLGTRGARVEGPGDQKRPCFPCIIVLPVCTLVLYSICNHHGFMYTYCIPSIIIRDYASPVLRSPSEQNFLPTETIKWTHHEPYQVDV